MGLEKAGLTLNMKKTRVAVIEVTFFDQNVSELRVRVKYETKERLVKFVRPKSAKRLQAFLGLVNWDR